jgi:predicted amidohydrolase
VLSPSGKLTVTYDKIHLYEKDGELARCDPGRQLKTVTISGMRCGLLVCNDSNRLSLYERKSCCDADTMSELYRATWLASAASVSAIGSSR